MHHPKILNKFGLTDARLREIFTCTDKESDTGKIRVKFEDRIRSRVNEGVRVCAENAALFQAVDLAWDAPPIQKETIPLLLWAQGKIKREALVTSLKDTPLADELIVKQKDGTLQVNTPRLYEMSITLVRSYVTRRLAAQTSRFANLWPYFRYEPRGVDQVSKLKAETLSQRVDVMVDAYNYRHFGTQLARDQLLYARSLAFPRGAWDAQTQWKIKDLNIEGDEPEVESYVTREGIEFVNPHPARCYWDLSAPLANINTDTGPCYVGYWDIIRYGTLLDGNYYNTDSIGTGEGWLQLISKYQNFFSQYFDPKVLKFKSPMDDPTLANSTAANTGLYTSEDKDRGCFIGQHFEKINPKHEGICDYDCDIWLRLSVAGDGTIVGAEPMPSIPACYGGQNEKDDRIVNASMAMELLAYQDQLSNMSSHMMMNLRSSMVQLWLLDKDSMEADTLKYFEDGAKQKDFFTEPRLLIYSSAKLKELGISDPSAAFKIIQADVTNTIEVCYNGMTRLLNLCDRLMILSPNELGQPAPREISAREVQEISNTTSSISTFVSDGIDEQRAAMKKLVYQSLICRATANFRVPAMQRYSVETLKAAGFSPADTVNLDNGAILPIKTPIIGTIKGLMFDYMFDSRDGAERTPNSQVSQTITQLIQFLSSNEAVAAAMGKRRLFDLVNEAVRLSGAGVDFLLSMDEGESDGVGNTDIAAALAQLTQRLGQLEQVVSAGPPTQGLPPGAQAQPPAPDTSLEVQPNGADVMALGAE
jgi:hypothetical protein